MGSKLEAHGSVAQVALPATCGELVQGTLDGVPCLVSCPIGWYSVATVSVWPGSDWELPPDVQKSMAALKSGLACLGCGQVGGQLDIHSDIPRGRGYGSSTADVGATLYALGEMLGYALPPVQAAKLAVGIEPSDSTLFPGLALFDHRGGSFHEELGPAPSLTVIVLDPGGQVDTVAFNRIDHRKSLRRLAPQHEESFALLRQGLARGDLASIGAAATQSSLAHQAILHNELLESAQRLSRDVHALGICRAHSGRLLGLLMDAKRSDVQAVKRFVARRLGDHVAVTSRPLVDGGPRILSGRRAVRG